MNEYLPFYALLVFIVTLLYVFLRIFIDVNKFCLISIGRLKSPYKINANVLKKNLSFYIGTDIKARLAAFKALLEIFNSNQDQEILQALSISIKRRLIFGVLSLAVVITGMYGAQGDGSVIIATAIAASIVNIMLAYKR